jgi:zinc transport system permease protein
MLFLSGGLALALAFVHLARDTVFSFENYLFGSILTLTQIELYAIGGATLLTLLLVGYFWYPLIGATQQPGFITPGRYTPQLIRLLYFWLLSLVVWIGIKTIGGLLIGALLVIPVLVVRPYAQSFRQTTLGAIGISLLSVLVGLLLALYVDLPPSSLIIGVLLSLFVAGTLFRTITK